MLISESDYQSVKEKTGIPRIGGKHEKALTRESFRLAGTVNKSFLFHFFQCNSLDYRITLPVGCGWDESVDSQ